MLIFSTGVNLRTGKRGIFPSAYAIDMNYNDFDAVTPKTEIERYSIIYLGSIETLVNKGTGTVCRAIKKIISCDSQQKSASQHCILEISEQGLRMVNKTKSEVNSKYFLKYYFYNKQHSF